METKDSIFDLLPELRASIHENLIQHMTNSRDNNSCPDCLDLAPNIVEKIMELCSTHRLLQAPYDQNPNYHEDYESFYESLKTIILDGITTIPSSDFKKRQKDLMIIHWATALRHTIINSDYFIYKE